MAEFSHLTLLLGLRSGGTAENFVMKFGIKKLESWGYQMVKKSAFFILTQYRCVTDRRTDTLLSQRPAIALRRAGKNGNNQTISNDILIRHI